MAQIFDQDAQLPVGSVGEGGVTAIGLQGRLNPSVRRAAQLIADGAIGRPISAQIVSTSGAFGPSTTSSYLYFEQAASGANLLTITAGHTLDLMEAVLGDMREVQARTPILCPTLQVFDTQPTATREVPDHADILGVAGNGTMAPATVTGAKLAVAKGSKVSVWSEVLRPPQAMTLFTARLPRALGPAAAAVEPHVVLDLGWLCWFWA